MGAVREQQQALEVVAPRLRKQSQTFSPSEPTLAVLRYEAYSESEQMPKMHDLVVLAVG